MAHLPTLPDPSSRRNPQAPSGPNDSQFSFTELTKILGQHGAGSSSEDLALDLLLHEVVSQACSTTNAAGAAIVLSRDGEFICRATSGKYAPELGSHLPANVGLSGVCIQSRELQRCDDTEADSRVDAAACRRLGIRSVVIVPLQRESEVIGVLEVFSPHAHVFTSGDVQTLVALSRNIVDTTFPPVEKDLIKEEPASSSVPLEVQEMPVPPKRDPWTVILAMLTLALALLLGWMLGHRGLGRIGDRGKTPADPIVTKPVESVPQPSVPTVSVPAAINPVLAPSKVAKTADASSGGLAVYENGKLVFQVKPVPGNTNAIAVQIPPDAATSLVLERVEPQYPDPARLAHIQGPVVLQVEVNDKGAVQELRALSGDPQLVKAAADAVSQWHFKPYAPQGHALNFQTQVTVAFKLP